ncbi:uncharacterized protein TNCV_3112061 [Trichonephila clavipes]|nr:uncharacterized protein TNCV_3112061 [Trichonephila clavipes]
MVVKRNGTTKSFQELEVFAMSLETLPEFNDIYDGIFPNPCMRMCTRTPYVFILRHAFFAHANVFHHGSQPVPIELSIASIPEDAKYPEVICLTVDHSNLLTTPKDSRANHYINELLRMKSHLP